MITGLMTVKEFVETRHELPDGGRWHELHSGRPQLLDAPDDEHGTVVLNLSKALAEWFRLQPKESGGYAVHDVGVHVNSAPDTVFFPSVSYFDEGDRFGQSDLVVASLTPRLVVDLASSNDRRQLMRERTLMYLKCGVEVVWVVDPFKREIQVLQQGVYTQILGERQTLKGDQLLDGFEIKIADVFAQPEWWLQSQQS